MCKWNPEKMKSLFKKKAKEQGISLTRYLEIFGNELSPPVSRKTMQRYLDQGPKATAKKSFYEKMEKDLGFSMIEDDFRGFTVTESYLEDREKKIPKFCQEKLEEAFRCLIEYFEEAYNGQYTLLFEKDYSSLLYYFLLYKPCMPNYLCNDMERFFKKKKKEIRDAAENSGIIILEGVGFGYRDELNDGEIPNPDDYNWEIPMDYIENNIEEHRKRVRKFMYDVAEFWKEHVERLYPEESRQAVDIMKGIEEMEQEKF